MYIIFNRVKFSTNIADQTTYQDHWQLCDTTDEARRQLGVLQSIHGDTLDSCGIATITDASEKGWIEK